MLAAVACCTAVGNQEVNVFTTKLGGIHVPHRKNTAAQVPVRIPIPSVVRISTQMHIGAPAIPTVKPMDKVCVGTLIADNPDKLCSPIYSSVSGTVKKIEEVGSAQRTSTFIVIESDGNMTPDEAIAPPIIESCDDFIAAVRKSGIVGLGGAGFPTYAKIRVPSGKIDTVVVNGAECEPHITSDTQTMQNEPEEVINGLKLLMKYIGIPRAVIGVEKNKPQCISALKNVIDTDAVTIKTLPSVYPQGGEKVLVYNTTGRIIGEGKLPLDAGVIVINCTTLAAISKYVKTGMPLVEKCVTVDGSAIAEPKNVIAPIGTPVSALCDFCGGFRSTPKKAFLGGPMMGMPITSFNEPIVKQTNAVVVLDEKEARIPSPTACIRCGKCYDTCPFGLMPFEIAKALELKKPEQLEKLKVNLCMECGCCSYVCPANRELVQQNKLAKSMLRDYQKEKGGAGK